MKRFSINVLMIAMVLGMSLAAQNGKSAELKPHDFREGSFEGNWCGLKARFDITKKYGSDWIFEGKIFLPATKQYDRIIIEQFRDNSLQMRRVLAGQNDGRYQVLVTHRPETLLVNGQVQVNFRVRQGSGPGSNNLGHLRMPTN